MSPPADHETEAAVEILIADGDEADAQASQRALSAAGWSCRAVAAPVIEAALGQRREQVALLVVDVESLGRVAWALLDEAIAGVPAVPVVMTATNDDEALAARCIERGAIDCVFKSQRFWQLLPAAVERALDVSQAIDDASRLAAVVGSSPDPIYSCTLDGLVENWNPAAERLTGWEAGQVIRRPWLRHFPLAEHGRIDVALQRAAEGRRTRFHCRRLRADGSDLPVMVACSPIPGPQDQPQGVAVVEQDQRSRQRAVQLHERSRRLGRINAELEAFAAVAAHDLQAPMRTVSLQLDLLREQAVERLRDEDLALLVGAQRTLRRSGEMIERMLAYAREACVDVSADRPVALTAICQAAVALLEQDIHAASATVEIADDLPVVHFDREQAIRVFRNLISNAIRYRQPERPPVVRISCVTVTDHQAQIDIADNGRGIARENQERIFLLHHGSTDVATSSGIGLAICRSLLEARDGWLRLEQSSGDGSVFRAALPCVDDDESGARAALVDDVS